MAQQPLRKPWFVVWTNGNGANQATQVKAMNDLVERQSGARPIRVSSRSRLTAPGNLVNTLISPTKEALTYAAGGRSPPPRSDARAAASS
jgi:hypothetical protein